MSEYNKSKGWKAQARGSKDTKKMTEKEKEQWEYFKEIKKQDLSKPFIVWNITKEGLLKPLISKPLRKIINVEMRTLFCGIYEEKNELLSELKTRPHITQKIYIYLKELIEKEKKEKSTNELKQMWVEKFSRKAKDRQEDFNNTQSWFVN